MPSDTEIHTKVTDYLKNELFAQDPAALEQPDGFLTDGLIDSISVMMLVEFLEQSFHIEFEPHEVDADNLDSLDLITGFVQQKMQAAPNP